MREVCSSFLSDFQNFFVAEFFFRQSGGEIGQAGKAGDFEAAGAGLDHFENGGHADGVGAEFLQRANFGGRFVLRAN